MVMDEEVFSYYLYRVYRRFLHVIWDHGPCLYTYYRYNCSIVRDTYSIEVEGL